MILNNPYEDPYFTKIKSLLDQALEHYDSDDDLHKYHRLTVELYEYLDKEITALEAAE